MGSEQEGTIYRFGQFEVDSRSGELRKQGLRLRLRGRPIDILLILLGSPGEVVTRETLRERLWSSDTFVNFDHGLHSAMNRLRETLGDAADNPRFIETLPRKGYRFIAPVTTVAPPPSPAPPSPTPPPPAIDAPTLATEALGPVDAPPIATAPPTNSRLVGIAVVLGIIAAIALGLWTLRTAPATDPVVMTIAVLPFTNLSGDPEQDYFSDGFTAELISELGMIEPQRLSVIGRTTSMLYKGANKSIGEIGKELGVMYLLEGSVRRSGSRMRITAQLVKTREMTNLWSNSYDRDVGDVLAVQTEVSRQIARSLALALAPVTGSASAAGRPSPQAYELFMRGRFFREQATEEGARKAIDYYERALAIDPNYAAAHAALADAYRLLGAPGWEVEPPTVLLTRAKAAAERALEIDPKSPEARAVLSMIKFNFEWDLAGAEREILEALRLNPSFAQAHQYYSSILTTMGRFDEAIKSATRAVELDPLSATASTTLGVRYYYAGRADDGIRQFTKTLEVTPGFSVAHWGLAQCYRLQRRLDEHLDQLRSAVQLSGSSSYMRSQLAYGYAIAGDRQRAEGLRKELEEEGRSKYLAPYHLALIAAGLGQTGEAVKWLERAFDDRSGWLVFLRVEPEFEAMRQAPEFQRLLTRVVPQQ